jgi:hypothetical protein
MGGVEIRHAMKLPAQCHKLGGSSDGIDGPEVTGITTGGS